MTTETIPPPIPPALSKPRLKIPGLVIGLVLGVVLTFTGVFAYSRLQGPPKSPTSFPTPTPVSPTASPAPKSEIEWLTPTLEQTPSILVSSPDSGYAASEAKLFYVANLPDATRLYDLSLPFEGPGAPYIYRLIKDSQGNFSYLRKHILDDWTLKNIADGKVFLSGVQASDILIRELSLPPEIIVTNNYKFKVNQGSGFSSQWFSDLKNPKLVESAPFGDVYSVYTSSTEYPQVHTREVFLKLKDSTLAPLQPVLGFFSDDQVPSVTWSDNAYNSKTQFNTALYVKCGAPYGNSVILNGASLISTKQVAGKVMPLGVEEKIYRVGGENEKLVQYLYKNFKVGRDYPSGPPVISITDFDRQKTHFLWQDKFGDWLLFVSSDYQIAAECGKPVIYLYPPRDTTVTVKVAADITQSEPAYSPNGWTVLAKPNGDLNHQGQSYPYLFWEGKGRGIYNSHSGEGFVVARTDLIPTVRRHLRLLGLNIRESDDFMDFWQSKLPHTPYVRLTWLGTQDMNQLAPLTVGPRPDTTIRLFLEFEGLNQPIKLHPQSLSSPARRGFTLVEWGGLLTK